METSALADVSTVQVTAPLFGRAEEEEEEEEEEAEAEAEAEEELAKDKEAFLPPFLYPFLQAMNIEFLNNFVYVGYSNFSLTDFFKNRKIDSKKRKMKLTGFPSMIIRTYLKG